MLLADLLSGAAPAALAVIGPIVMGVPLAVAVGRYSRSAAALPVPRRPVPPLP